MSKVIKQNWSWNNLFPKDHVFKNLEGEDETFDDCEDFPDNIEENIWYKEIGNYSTFSYHLKKLTNDKYIYVRVWHICGNEWLTKLCVAKDISTLIHKGMSPYEKELYFTDHPVTFDFMLSLIGSLGQVT